MVTQCNGWLELSGEDPPPLPPGFQEINLKKTVLDCSPLNCSVPVIDSPTLCGFHSLVALGASLRSAPTLLSTYSAIA